MMLNFLGEKDSAIFLYNAIKQVLADSSAPHTPDIGGTATTSEVGDAITSKIV